MDPLYDRVTALVDGGEDAVRVPHYGQQALEVPRREHEPPRSRVVHASILASLPHGRVAAQVGAQLLAPALYGSTD